MQRCVLQHERNPKDHPFCLSLKGKLADPTFLPAAEFPEAIPIQYRSRAAASLAGAVAHGMRCGPVTAGRIAQQKNPESHGQMEMSRADPAWNRNMGACSII